MNTSLLVHILHLIARLRSHSFNLRDSPLCYSNVSLLIPVALLRPRHGQTQAIHTTQVVSDETKPIASRSSYERFLQSILLPLIRSLTLLACWQKCSTPTSLTVRQWTSVPFHRCGLQPSYPKLQPRYSSPNPFLLRGQTSTAASGNRGRESHGPKKRWPEQILEQTYKPIFSWEFLTLTEYGTFQELLI